MSTRTTQTTGKGVWKRLKKLKQNENKLQKELDACESNLMRERMQYANLYDKFKECEGSTSTGLGKLSYRKRKSKKKRKSKSKPKKKKTKRSKKKKTKRR